jgi:hypothetical protein
MACLSIFFHVPYPSGDDLVLLNITGILENLQKALWAEGAA